MHLKWFRAIQEERTIWEFVRGFSTNIFLWKVIVWKRFSLVAKKETFIYPSCSNYIKRKTFCFKVLVQSIYVHRFEYDSGNVSHHFGQAKWHLKLEYQDLWMYLLFLGKILNLKYPSQLVTIYYFAWFHSPSLDDYLLWPIYVQQFRAGIKRNF